MKTETLNWISRFFRYLLITIAILYIIIFLIIVFFRVQYPFELEWMEGGSLEHVSRIISGHKLYVSPSLEFVPYIYTPLYYYLCALVAKCIGIGFMPLRLVSFLSSLGSLLVIFLIVKRETKSKFAGIIASCLFAATFRISGAWVDIARPDSLFLFFILIALYLIKFNSSLKSYAFGGVFFALAFLTKQTALAVSLPIMLYCFYAGWRHFLVFGGVIFTIIGASTLFLNHIHDGWYTYYIFDLPSQHSLVKEAFITFWTADIMLPLAIACSMSLFYLLTQLMESKKKNCLFYFLTAAGMLGVSFIARLNVGGYNNVLLPAYAILSILFGLGINSFLELMQTFAENKRKLVEIWICLFCIIQFAVLQYNPLSQIPTQKDKEAGRKLVTTIQQIKGDVWIPYHGYLAVMAGKSSYVHQIALWEITEIFEGKGGGGMRQEGREILDEIAQAVREKRFGAVILDDPRLFRSLMEKDYKIQQKVFNNDTVFWPVTGMRTRPDVIWFPKN